MNSTAGSPDIQNVRRYKLAKWEVAELPLTLGPMDTQWAAMLECSMQESPAWHKIGYCDASL